MPVGWYGISEVITMDRPKSNLDFKLMGLIYKIRDLMRPRMDLLKEAGVEPGCRVLDYGCGPGSYILPLADLVGDAGKVYALDIHPLALKMVQRVASKRGLKNVETILSSCATGLPDESLELILLYDVFHDLSQPDEVLRELHRVLKPQGILSFSDHHMKESDIVSELANGGLFTLSAKGRKTYRFLKHTS